MKRGSADGNKEGIVLWRWCKETIIIILYYIILYYCSTQKYFIIKIFLCREERQVSNSPYLSVRERCHFVSFSFPTFHVTCHINVQFAPGTMGMVEVTGIRSTITGKPANGGCSCLIILLIIAVSHLFTNNNNNNNNYYYYYYYYYY